MKKLLLMTMILALSTKTFPGGWGWFGPAAVGATVVGVSVHEHHKHQRPEYQERKNLREQIRKVKEQLRDNPNDRNLKTELRRLKKDLRYS